MELCSKLGAVTNQGQIYDSLQKSVFDHFLAMQ